MKTVLLLHNPTAGDMEYSKEKLIDAIENGGYTCRYNSTKEDEWQDFDASADILAVAGGEGTLRKAAMEILKRELKEKETSPIAFIPLGTANNLGKSMGLMREPEELVASWEAGDIKGLDVGKIKGCGDKLYFIEAFGFGIFPNLMNNMKKMDTREDVSAEEELELALKETLKIIKEYKARDCNLVIDGIDHSGKFLLVEIMNIKSIGPNLELNPLGDPYDGEFEIIIIPEDQRERLEIFVQNKIDGSDENISFSSLKGKDISITWDGKHGHVDDEIVKADKTFDISLHMHQGILSMLMPGAEQ